LNELAGDGSLRQRWLYETHSSMKVGCCAIAAAVAPAQLSQTVCPLTAPIGFCGYSFDTKPERKGRHVGFHPRP
jgi:hypothetical protein